MELLGPVVDAATTSILNFVKDAFQFLLPDSFVLRILFGLLIASILSIVGYKRFNR